MMYRKERETGMDITVNAHTSALTKFEVYDGDGYTAIKVQDPNEYPDVTLFVNKEALRKLKDAITAYFLKEVEKYGLPIQARATE